MAKHGINKVILVGNLGSDPESRHGKTGTCFTSGSLATSESWKDKQGEQQERTEWHRLVFIDRGNYKLGEYAAELQKGEKLYVEGRLQTRKWQDDAGNDRYTTEVVVEEFQRLTPRPDKPAGQAQPTGQAQRVEMPELAEDDIPF